MDCSKRRKGKRFEEGTIYSNNNNKNPTLTSKYIQYLRQEHTWNAVSNSGYKKERQPEPNLAKRPQR